MNTRRLALLLFALALGGCATTPPVTLVSPGPVQVGTLTMTAGSGWNDLTDTKRRPGCVDPGRPDDRPAVGLCGRCRGRDAVQGAEGLRRGLPRFRPDMLPNELVTFTESYLGKMFGEGQAVVTTSNLRPQRFWRQRRPDVRCGRAAGRWRGPQGTVGAFIADSKLFLMVYLAVDPYYFDLNREAADGVIVSARR
jgi:hypothetical protein